MSVFLQFLVLGLGVGAVYALSAQGLIMIYRGSGVLNFAYAAIGMLGAYACWDLQQNAGCPFLAALIAGVAVSATVGALTQLLVIRRLEASSALTRVIATLGVLLVLQAVIVLRYGSSVTIVHSSLPQHIWKIGSVALSAERLILILVAVALTAALWFMFKYTKFGLGTVAVAENRRSAAALGWSGTNVATATWTIGSALAGLAVILIAPITQLQVNTATNLLLAALAVALLAQFSSFPIALLAGLAVGVVQSEFVHYTTTPGLPEAIPFLVIAAVLVLRGKSLPLRDYRIERLPSVGDGRVRPWLVLATFVVLALVIFQVPADWASAFGVTFAVAAVLLSITVLTGYTGQLSLAQYGIAGLGAYIAGRLGASYQFPFVVCLLLGILGSVVIGLVFAVPAIRTRGINLAIVTVGLGSAVQLLIFNNPKYVGGYSGTTVASPSIFGLSIDNIVHPARYALFCVSCYFVAALVVANVRRGASGGRLLAVRTNERAAAALGISVAGAKVYSFALSSTIAALGGVLVAFENNTIVYDLFTPTTSILFLGLAVIGGVGYLAGPVLGATLASGALGVFVANSLFSGISKYIQLISGVALLFTVLANPDGMVRGNIQVWRLLSNIGPVRRRFVRPSVQAPDRPAEEPQTSERTAVTAQSLVLSDVGVRYGATTAVSHLSLEVNPGQVVGLIGPNGAGKTSAIDAITGFVGSSTGSITIGGTEVHGMQPSARARLGLGRSFQSLELFEDMSVHDNLMVASDDHHRSTYLRDVLNPRRRRLSTAAMAVVRDFRLSEALPLPVRDLSYGQRRHLAIARAVAPGPSVLLLDEPAAGLSDDDSKQLARTIRELADSWGIAVLLVEHDMDLVMSACDQLVVLDFGSVIARGTPSEVTANPAVIQAYLGLEDTSSLTALATAPAAYSDEQS